MIKNIVFLICMLSGFILNSCEDDALLAPQSGNADDGGSYGNISFPTDPQKNKTVNPETF